MIKTRLAIISLITLFAFSFSSCTQMPNETDSPDPVKTTLSFAKITAQEGFETGSKTAYTAADVTLSSGVWNLNEALIGNSTSDRKSGSWSARIRNSGKLTMKFNVSGGISTVTVKHAKYGTDANSTWEVWYSSTSGSSWTKAGSTVTTSSTTLATATFTINSAASALRIEIRKTDGTSARLNIDDIVINDNGTVTPPSSSVHLTLGNPSGAVTNTSYPTNYLMEKAQYALSYHRDKGTPNWVAWHLSSAWVGSTARQDDFRADGTLPSGWYQVGSTSYSGSGFDRGHMCPSADRTLTVTDNSATFLMTNMVPQAPNNNQGPWASMENYLRTLVDSGKEMYIYSGGYGVQKTIDAGRITVPASTWKVVVVLDNGSNDLSRVTATTRVITVEMTNYDANISRSADWKTFRTTVDAIEAKTGYDFLNQVSASIQSVIESKVDNL